MRSKRWGMIVAPVLLAVVLAACGGGSTSAAKAASTTTTGRSTATIAAYRACLKQHGVDLPARPAAQGADGAPGSSVPTGSARRGFRNPTPAQQKAFQACASLAPAGGFGGRTGANRAAFTAYRSCLSDHGVDMTQSTGGPAGNQAYRNDPKFADANKVCSALLPAPGAAGSTSTTTQGS
jgi:hypothetical protein